MTYTIAHITDLHIPTPQVFAKGDRNLKRILGHISWERNRKAKHLMAVLDALRADLKENNPDYICITGDMTNLGLDNEFKASADWVKSLGMPDDKISVIPGNHDTYGAEYNDKIIKYWGSWMKREDGTPGFPFIHKAGPAAVIGLSSAVETWPFYANGIIPEEQINEMEAILKALPEDTIRIVLCHHPIQEDASVHRKALWEADKLRAFFAENRIDIYLHGHTHRIHHEFIDGPQYPVAVLGAGSASYSNKRTQKHAHYQYIDIDENNIIDTVIRHRIYDPASGTFKHNGDAKLYDGAKEGEDGKTVRHIS